jgi:hypothetical protein
VRKMLQKINLAEKTRESECEALKVILRSIRDDGLCNEPFQNLGVQL